MYLRTYYYVLTFLVNFLKVGLLFSFFVPLFQVDSLYCWPCLKELKILSLIENWKNVDNFHDMARFNHFIIFIQK